MSWWPWRHRRVIIVAADLQDDDGRIVASAWTVFEVRHHRLGSVVPFCPGPGHPGQAGTTIGIRRDDARQPP